MPPAESFPAASGNVPDVPARLWRLLEEVRYRAQVLRTQSEAVYRDGPRIRRQGTSAERAEHLLMLDTDAPWKNMASALNGCERVVPIIVSPEVVMVSEAQLLQRINMVEATSHFLQVTEAAARPRHLVKDTGLAKPHHWSYQGPCLGPALHGAAAAIHDYRDNVCADVAHRLLTLISSQPAPAAKNSLALPGTAVPSRPLKPQL